MTIDTTQEQIMAKLVVESSNITILSFEYILFKK